MNLDHKQHYSKPRVRDLITDLAAQFCAYQNNCAKWDNLIEGKNILKHSAEKWHMNSIHIR